MICIIIVGGFRIELQGEHMDAGSFESLDGIPKPLLPRDEDKKILDQWWDIIKGCNHFSAVYLITDAAKYKHYERWATASEFLPDHIINDGSTTQASRMSTVARVSLALRVKHVDDDILVVSGDMAFHDNQWEMEQILNFFNSKKSHGDVMVYSELENENQVARRDRIEVNAEESRVIHFRAAASAECSQRGKLANVLLYCFASRTLPMMEKFISMSSHAQQLTLGCFMEWLVRAESHNVFAMSFPLTFHLLSEMDFNGYIQWRGRLCASRASVNPEVIRKRAYARVGLMGNPSDGFNGKTIAMSISNFWAEVWIHESAKLELRPHPLYDPTKFGSLSDLHGISSKEGYAGGLRLLQATCKKFHQYCLRHRIPLSRKNFTLCYDTNIPRQVGLAGSSAIVTAVLKALLKFYGLNTSHMPVDVQPQVILEVEREELGISAGLQDRVVQVHEGLMFMDFNLRLLSTQGHGNYSWLDTSSLAQFWLAYEGAPSDSGKIHSDVYRRWQSGDEDVVSAMKHFAKLTDRARTALQSYDWSLFADLMDENFTTRRKLYGDAVLGATNLRMVEIARSFNSAAKFPGSGGAVVGLCRDQATLTGLRKAMDEAGFVFCLLSVNCGGNDHEPTG